MIEEDVKQLKYQLEKLTASISSGLVCSNANVSNPPTDAELDAEFGAASGLYNGFSAIIDDSGSGTTVWFVVVKNSAWWYEQLTKAV